MFGDLTDVQQAVGSGKNFDKCAEISQARDFAQIGLADLSCGGKVADQLQRLRRRSFVVGSNIHSATVFDVDFDAGLLDDAANHLPAGPDHVANLVDWNLQRVNAGSECGNLLAWSTECFSHLVENVEASALCLRKGFAHHRNADAGDLDVHLEGGDTGASAGDFEIHVAVVIFGASDVGQDGVFVVITNDEAHSDARAG